MQSGTLCAEVVERRLLPGAETGLPSSEEGDVLWRYVSAMLMGLVFVVNMICVLVLTLQYYQVRLA